MNVEEIIEKIKNIKWQVERADKINIDYISEDHKKYDDMIQYYVREEVLTVINWILAVIE